MIGYVPSCSGDAVEVHPPTRHLDRFKTIVRHGIPLVSHRHTTLYTPPQASLVMEDKSIRQEPTRALKSS